MGFGLCVSLVSIELNLDLCFVNIYGPYIDREKFWNNFLNMDCLKCDRLILGGDLNFSLGLSKIWGVTERVDCLSNFFTKTMENFGLVDIDPSVMLPTRSNRRVGDDSICKRLDRLLGFADLLDHDYLFCQWVGCGGDSDHNPIFLQVLNKGLKDRSPFKFNDHWLTDENLVCLLKDTWVVYNDNLFESPTSQFSTNLNF